MVVAGCQQAHVVTDVHAANVGNQGFIGWREADVAFVERLVLRVHPIDVETTWDASSIVVDEFFRPKITSVGSAVVAVNAVFVEHRLHFASEVEATRWAVPRVEFACQTEGGTCTYCGRRHGGIFMAADARDVLTRPGREPSAHQLHGLTFGI